MSTRQMSRKRRLSRRREVPDARHAMLSSPQSENGTPPALCEARAVISALPPVAGADLSEIGRRYAAALPRVLARTPPRAVGASVVLMPLAVTAIASVANHQLVELSHGRPPRSAVFLTATAYSIALAVLGVFIVAAIRRRSRSGYVLQAKPREGKDFSLAAMVGVIVLASAVPLLTALSRISAAQSSLVTYSPAIFGLAIVPLAIQALGYRIKVPRPAAPLQALDRVGTRLVVMAAAAHACALGVSTPTQDRVRSMIGELEMLARDAERFALPRVPWWDRSTRHTASLEGSRLAAVIRAHKRQLATATSAEDFAAIARSLTGGASAWSRDDLPAMVRGAPNLGRRRVLTTLRQWPAALLVTTGIVMPLLPPLSSTLQAAAGFRVALLIAAVLSLATGAV